MPIPKVRLMPFRGAMVWEVDARALAAECLPRKIPLRRKFPTRSAADAWAREILTRIDTIPEHRAEVRDFCDRFLQSRRNRLAERTQDGYRTALKRLTKFCHASGIVHTDQLDRAAVGEYADHLHATVSSRTAGQYLIVASVCFGWGVDRGYLPFNPFTGFGYRPRRSPRRILTDDERNTILTKATHRDLWLFMLGTGCRAIEVLRIRADDVRTESPQPHVNVLGKGDKQRTVPIGPEVAAAALRLLEDNDGKLWPRGQRELNRAWVADREALQLPDDITPHAFRHDYASWLVNVEQLPLPDVQRVLGHSNIATTAIYLHPDGRRLAGAVAGRSKALCFQPGGNRP